MTFWNEYKEGVIYGSLSGLAVFIGYYIWKQPVLFSAMSMVDNANTVVDTVATIQPAWKIAVLFVIVGAMIGLVVDYILEKVR